MKKTYLAHYTGPPAETLEMLIAHFNKKRYEALRENSWDDFFRAEFSLATLAMAKLAIKKPLEAEESPYFLEYEQFELAPTNLLEIIDALRTKAGYCLGPVPVTQVY